MLGRCSPASLYRRFHGVTDGTSYVAEQFAGGGGAEGCAAWDADRCVGLANLHVDGLDSAEIGVLVEDGWQRRGVGSALVGAVVYRARELGLTRLRAEVLGDSTFLIPILARIGRTKATLACGSYSVQVALEPQRTSPVAAARSGPGDDIPRRTGRAGATRSSDRVEAGELP